MSEIHSPTGIDLNPDPPPVVRLSRRAGAIVLLIVAVVMALIGYGVLTRNQRSLQIGFQMDETKGVTAATDAGKVVAAQVPARPMVVTNTPSLDLIPPEGPAGREPVSAPPPRLAANASYVSPPASYPPPPAAPAYREPSPEERQLAALYAREQEAVLAPTTARTGFTVASAPASPAAGPSADLAQIAGLLRTSQKDSAQGSTALPRFSFPGSGASQSEEYEAQNMQERKEAFLDRARKADRNSYLDSTRTAPMGKYEIKAGWDIPAVLEQALNSDLPGEVKALVRENVYDTATGRHLLIPQGARLVGLYDSRIAYGQDGIMVVWNRILFPDGSSIHLDGMSSQDATGATGLRHDVDNYYRRLLGFGFLTSAFSAAFQLSQTRRGGLLGYPSSTEVAGSAVGREMSQLGADVTRRNLNVQPTIKVPIGYRFNVRVNRDMLFESPYRPVG